MAKKVTLSKLVAQIESGALSPKDAEKYFVTDSHAGAPFGPGAKFAKKLVDTTAFGAQSDVIATALAKTLKQQGAAHVPGRTAAVRAASPADATKLVASTSASILAEGDSWFDLPFIWPRTIVDILGETRPIVTLAKAGDTMRNMLDEAQFVKPLKAGGVKYFLFSGGGNDVVGGGDLKTFINLFDPDFSKPTDALYYIKDAYYDMLDGLMGNYAQLAAMVRKASPSTVLVVHGYSFVIPQIDGPWVGGPMAIRGLDPVHMAPLCQAIIRKMIEAFNARLASFAASSSGRVVHINLTGLVKPNEWFDELHPREVAARRMAAAYEAKLNL